MWRGYKTRRQSQYVSHSAVGLSIKTNGRRLQWVVRGRPGGEEGISAECPVQSQTFWRDKHQESHQIIRLPTGGEFRDDFLTFGIKREFVFTPVYQPDCSSGLQTWTIGSITQFAVIPCCSLSDLLLPLSLSSAGLLFQLKPTRLCHDCHRLNILLLSNL